MTDSVIIFSKSLNSSEAKTRLRNSLAANFVQELHQAMIFDTLSTVEKTETTDKRIYWTPKIAEQNNFCEESLAWESFLHFLQQGKSFGERFQHCIQETFRDTDCSALCIIGTDCPLISPDLLHIALQAAREGKIAIGPAQRGGFYLLALPRGSEDFDLRPAFESENEQEAILKILDKFPREILAELFDIDLAEDLNALKSVFEGMATEDITASRTAALLVKISGE